MTLGGLRGPMWVCGVDGCRSGWIVVQCELRTGEARWAVFAHLGDVVAMSPAPIATGVDIPIGLLDEAVPGGRVCDRQARALLGRPRAASVFSPPVRAALRARTYRGAVRAQRGGSPARVGLSRQTFGLFGKLREADALMTPALQGRVVEVFPELSFFEMNGGKAMVWPKRSPRGRRVRQELLRRHGFAAVVDDSAARRLKGVALDDLLDACAACWTAARIARRAALRIPTQPPRDGRGLRMEIWR